MRSHVLHILRGVLQLAGVALGIATVNFFLLRLAPGDVVQVIAGEAGGASADYVAVLRVELGLDQPLWTQYATYIGRLLQLDLGYSYRQGVSVLSLILDRVPATLLLMGSAIAFAALGGALLGTLAAYRAGKWLDLLISCVSLLCFATPVFWIGLVFVVVFSVWLDWLPVSGMATVSSGLSGFALAMDVGRHLILPSATLGLFYMSIYTRLMRATLIEIRRKEFVRTALARGVRPARLFRVHILRNAALPFITMLGVQVSSVIGGAVVVETVFAWPGLGRLAFDALIKREFNLLLGILLFSSLFVVLVHWAVDALYRLADPRVETR